MILTLQNLRETAITILDESARLEGKVTLEAMARIHGEIIGEVHAREGSTLILGETSVIEGDIQADTLLVDGYVRGDIRARTRVVVSSTGRVIGNIRTPSLQLEFGSHFEGECVMEEKASAGLLPVTPDPALKPV